MKKGLFILLLATYARSQATLGTDVSNPHRVAIVLPVDRVGRRGVYHRLGSLVIGAIVRVRQSNLDRRGPRDHRRHLRDEVVEPRHQDAIELPGQLVMVRPVKQALLFQIPLVDHANNAARLDGIARVIEPAAAMISALHRPV
mgnify:CR=1 FL=1